MPDSGRAAITAVLLGAVTPIAQAAPQAAAAATCDITCRLTGALDGLGVHADGDFGGDVLNTIGQDGYIGFDL